VVLLHGNPTWSFLYRNFIPILAQKYRVIAPDHMGCGLSEKPAALEAYSLETHIANLVGLLDQIGARQIILVGHDWGGPIGIGYGLQRNNHLRGLVLMNTWAWCEASKFHTAVFPWRTMHAPIAGPLLFQRRNILVERGIYLSTYHRDRISGAVLEGYRFPTREYDQRVGLLAWPRMIPLRPEDVGWKAMHWIESNLGTLNVPTKIIWGADDIVFPPEFARMFCRRLPDVHGEPIIIETARHFLQEDEPEKITHVILQFLEEIGAED